MTEHVRLRVPATTGHIGLIRATSSGLAARLDFTYDRLTDLHIGIDEVCGRMLATCEPAPTLLDVTFAMQRDGLGVTVRGDAPLKPGGQFLNAWSRLILESIAGEVEVEEGPTGVAVSFLVKRTEQPA